MKRWPGCVLLSLGMLISGCGSGDGSSSPSGARPGGSVGGNVQVVVPLSEIPLKARVVRVDSGATQTVFTGQNAQGATIFGPVTLPRAAKNVLQGVPREVVSLRMEYRDGSGALLATGRAGVKVVTGKTVTVLAQVQKALTLQLVNESEVGDDSVYVLLSANGQVSLDLEGGTLATYSIGTGSADVVSTPLSQLHQVGTRLSPLTGKTRPVYEILPQRVVSGRLWVSYRAPLTYKKGDNAPGNFENVRFDKVELGYDPNSGNPTGFFDLTSVDFFGVPMQMEVLADPQDDTPFRIATFYTSTRSLLKSLQALNSATMSQSFYKVGGTASAPGWSPDNDSLSTFARAMSPSTLVSVTSPTPGAPFSASPYPSFRNYLTTLANKGTVVTLQGAGGVDGGPLTSWYYQASVASDGQGGFLVECQPTATMSSNPQGSLGDSNYPSDPLLPKDLNLEVPLTSQFLDQFAYGIPANAFRVKNLDSYLSPYSANSIYATIAGNFLAGLNFGYVDGRYGNDATHWFDILPGYPPYGAARKAPDDGYYNAYAAILYNQSDSYSYSISDRLQIGNPLLTTSPDQPYLRVTVLPDNRLDAPGNIQLTPGPSSGSLNVAWDPIATPPPGFSLTGYKVVAIDGSVPLLNPNSPELPGDLSLNQITLTTSPTSATISGLQPGTAYRVNVLALGTFNGQPVQSVSGQFATLATPADSTPPPKGPTINFVVGLAPPNNLASGVAFSVDGQSISGSSTVSLSRPAPDANGELVRALFQITASDPSNPGAPARIVSQANLFLNVFLAGTNLFDPFFNFPFSSAVPPAGSAQTRLLDGSAMNLAYNTTTSSEPPFAFSGNSLSVNLTPTPTDAAKSVAAALFPSSTPVALLVPGPTIAAPAYSPPPYSPVAPAHFKVQAVLTSGAPTPLLQNLQGATVSFVRLVTYPSNGTNSVNVPGPDGGGNDAAAVLDQNGSVVFDPTLSPYAAPIWNLGYRVDVNYQNILYSAYGSWRSPAVGPEWNSGLPGQANQPGVIYVPIGSPQGQVVWGN